MLFYNRKSLIFVQFQNLMGSSDPVLNPFYYAQDRESWYAEVASTACEESRQQEIKKKKMKKKKNESKVLKNRSFIMREEPGHIRRIIKIIIHDVDGRKMEDIDSDPESASVNIQYLVRNDLDEIMNETDYLVSKIVKKLSSN